MGSRRAENTSGADGSAPSQIGSVPVPTKTTNAPTTTKPRARSAQAKSQIETQTKSQTKSRAASSRRTARKPLPALPRPRLVEDDLRVDQAEHDARDAHLLDLLDRVCA